MTDRRSAGFGLGSGLPPWEEFLRAADRGEVWLRRQGDGSASDLVICTYTPRTIYERRWNPVTRAARGLIVRPATGEVVALPLPKFGNWGEELEPGVVADVRPDPCEVLVKLDGSLGILYRHEDRIRWATRGSLETSAQSRAALAIWEDRYRHHDDLLLGAWDHLTLLVEIIHPVTRVVCRYDFEDLILIAARDRFTGADLPHEDLVAIGDRLGMRVVERVEATPEAIRDRVRTLDENEEGFVLRWPDGYRLKVKGRAYLDLHRVLSNLTPDRQARYWHEGRLGSILRSVPEEFRPEVEKLAADLDARADREHQVIAGWAEAAARAAGGDRSAFGRWIQTEVPRDLRSAIFHQQRLADPGGAEWLAGQAILDVWRSGRLADLIAERPALAGAIDRAERLVADRLWADTRDPAGRATLRAGIKRLPAPLRRPIEAVVNDLDPAYGLDQARRQARRPEVAAEIGSASIEEMFARLPAPDVTEPELRTFLAGRSPALRACLERSWRAVRPETALSGARRLLATAWDAGHLADLLRSVAPEGGEGGEALTATVAAGLEALRADLASLWREMVRPVEDGGRGGQDPWRGELRRLALAIPRQRALDRFLAELGETDPAGGDAAE